MKKMKYPALAILLLSSSIISLIPSNVVAASETAPIVTHEKQGNLDITNYNYLDNPISYDFKDQEVYSISPQYIPYDGKEYNSTTKTLYKQKSWGTVVTNDSSIADHVSRTVSREKFANGSIGLSAESEVNWKIIKGKIGINGEVAWGTKTTTSVTYSYNIAPRTVNTISVGSQAVQTIGSLIEYRNGKVFKTTPINVSYSYDEYSSKSEKPL